MTTILSGLTAITTITLFEDYTLVDVFEDVRNAGHWINKLLPENKLVKIVVYSAGTLLLLRAMPLLLRRTDFFSYFDRGIKYFHRTSNHKQILRMKKELLSELKEGNTKFPLYKDELVILELNIGGGTNLSFYPDGTHLIATDCLDESKDNLENNFLLRETITLSQYLQTSTEELNSVPDETVSCVVCFHSLCSVRNTKRALKEIKRVLMPSGKLYFIEHTRETRRFSFLWFAQKNFRLNMFLVGCCLKKPEDDLEMAGFSELHFTKETLDYSDFIGPMYALSPHVYGYAKK